MPPPPFWTEAREVAYWNALRHIQINNLPLGNSKRLPFTLPDGSCTPPIRLNDYIGHLMAAECGDLAYKGRYSSKVIACHTQVVRERLHERMQSANLRAGDVERFRFHGIFYRQKELGADVAEMLSNAEREAKRRQDDHTHSFNSMKDGVDAIYNQMVLNRDIRKIKEVLDCQPVLAPLVLQAIIRIVKNEDISDSETEKILGIEREPNEDEDEDEDDDV